MRAKNLRTLLESQGLKNDAPAADDITRQPNAKFAKTIIIAAKFIFSGLIHSLKNRTK